MNARSIDQYSAAIWPQGTQSKNLVSGQKQQVFGAALTHYSSLVGVTAVNVHSYWRVEQNKRFLLISNSSSLLARNVEA
jgi:hypothetical protein